MAVQNIGANSLLMEDVPNLFGTAPNPADAGPVQPTSTATPDFANLPIVPILEGYGGVSIPWTFEPDFGTKNPQRDKDEAIQKLTDNILAQGTKDKWTTGSGLSKEQAARYMAEKLYTSGITRLEDFGQRDGMQQVPVVTAGGQSGYNRDSYAYLGEGGEGPNYGWVTDFVPLTPEQQAQVKDGQLAIPTGQKEYYNKTTGQAIAPEYDRSGMQPNTWGGTFAGDSSTGFSVQFSPLGMPIFTAHYDVESNPFGMILSFASMIPSPIQPFAMALNAAYQYSQGNTTGAVLSALGSYSTYVGAATTAAQAAEVAQDIKTAQELGMTVSELAASGLSVTSAEVLNNLDTLSKIQTVQQGVGVLNAVKTNNWAGIVNGLVNMGPQIGVTIPEDLVKPVQFAAAGSAASRGDWTAFGQTMGTLTKNSNFALATTAANTIKAVQSGKPEAIFASFLGLARQANLGTSVVKDTANQAGLPLSDKKATDLLAATPEQADAQVQEYYKQVNTVKDAYQKAFGQEISNDLLAKFGEGDSYVSGFSNYVKTPEGQQDFKMSPAGQAAEVKQVKELYQSKFDKPISDEALQQITSSGKGALSGYNDYLQTPAVQMELMGEFAGVDKAVAEAAKRNTVTIANADADDPHEAAALARIRDPKAPYFTYAGNTYSLAGTNAEVAQAYKDAELARIATSSTRSAAFAEARKLLGAGSTFDWTDPKTGVTQQYPTSTSDEIVAAAQKRIDLMPASGGTQNTRTGRPANAENVFIDKKTGDIVNDTRVYNADGTVASGTLETNYSSPTIDEGTRILGNIIKTSLDVGSGFIKGTGLALGQVGTLGALIGIADPKNLLTKTGEQIAASVNAMRDASFNTTSATMQAAISKAGNEGFLAQIVETGKQYGSNPAQTIEFIASNGISLLVGGGAMTAFRALGAGMTLAETATIATQAALQGASVAQEAYDDAIKNKKPPDEALNAARIAGSAGAFSSLLLNKFIPGAISNTQLAAGQALVQTNFKKALIGEMSSEAAEELSGKIAGNMAAGNPWDKDLGATLVQSLIGSGAVTGLMHAGNIGAPGSPSTVYAIAKDAGVTDAQIKTLQTEASSLSSMGEIAKIEATFKATLAAAGFDLQQIESLTGPVVTEAVTNDAIATLKAAGVPAGQIATIAQQITTEITSGHDPSETAYNLLTILDANNVDSTKANTMAADYTGLMTTAQVQQVVADAITKNPNITAAEVKDVVNTAVKDFATLQQVKEAISGITLPAGMTKADVTSAISTYMKDNPGVSISDIATEVTNATKGLATTKGVQTAISDALTGYATTADIKEAIKGITFPEGVSKADVTAAISTYMKDNPGLSLADVSTKITEATKGLATDTGVQTAIGDALKGYATTADIEKAIKGIEFPAGLTKEDVVSSITEFMTDHPGLTLSQVAEEIAKSTEGLATSTGVEKTISDALKGYATKTDIETAIKGIEFPAGLTKADVAAEIKSAMEANPGLSAADVTKSITDYMKDNPGLTATDVSTAISTATKGLATTKDIETATKDLATATSVADLKTDLEKAIKDATDAGLTGDEALQKAIDAVAETQKTDAKTLLDTLGTTAADLKTEFATSLETLSTDVQTKYDALTKAQKATADALVAQGTDLATAITTAQTQTSTDIANLGTSLNARIDELVAQGNTQQEATQKAFDEINAQNTQLSSQIGTQGRTAAQTDIDALTKMLSGNVAPDLAYDVTGDKKVTQDDLDFLTGVVTGKTTDWRPTTGPWAATGLYGQLQQNQWAQQDAAAKAAADAAQRDAEAKAAAESAAKLANFNATKGQAQQTTQNIMQQLQAMNTANAAAAAAPIPVVEAGAGFNVEDALNTSFFGDARAKKPQQTPVGATKIASGGYLDDLLAQDTSTDDLLSLLR